MKKKRLYLLTLATVMALGSTSALPSYAAPAGSYESLKENRETQKLYKEGQALVLYKSGTASSKKSAKSVLSMGSEIQVENFWNFENPEGSTDNGKNSDERGDKEGAGVSSMANADGLSVGLVSSKSLSTKQLIEKLKKEDNVETAEPNYRLHALKTNDAYYDKQWAFENNGQNGGTEGETINIEEKWKETKGSDEVVVAVVDTGVDYTHEDLKDNIWENPYQPTLKGQHGFDFLNGDSDPTDDNGHGTHCAGIIGAKGDNGTGVTGVNHNVKIMALKILDESGSGYGDDEVNAYHYINKALNLGVNIKAINNSWGGGEKSEIFAKLMDLVGAKGAVSVCAAGNDGADNDEEINYPSGYESTYKIAVAASDESGNLAPFSNYGKETVDLAAPGTDILSTVSYNCYNPSLYTEEKQKSLSSKFNDFEGSVPEDLKWNIPAEETAFFNENSADESGKYQAEVTDGKYFGAKGGHSLKLSFGTLASGEYAGIKIPYTVNQGKEAPVFSAMIKGSGPVSDESILAVISVPAGTEPDDNIQDMLITYDAYGIYISGEDDDWSHFEMPVADTEEMPEADRELWLVCLSDQKGEYSVYLDDIGLSSENADASEFGKYDFYSGTSMATPFVTGAVALESALDPSASVEERIDNVLGHARTSDALAGRVQSGGTLDFGKSAAPRPRIGDVSVNVDKKQIQIKGSGLDAEDLEVKVTSSGQEKTAKIQSKKKESVVISDDSWINRLVTISVTGNGKTSIKKDVYLVKGKAGYSKVKNLPLGGAENMTSDGKTIYSTDSAGDSVLVMDMSDPEYREFEQVFHVNPAKYFKKDADGMGEYDFTFGKDLIYLDGKLYNVAAYSEVSYSGGYDDDEDFKKTGQSKDDDEDDDGELMSGVSYSSQYRLLCFDLKTEKIVNLGELPGGSRQTEDWTLAGYNGNLYLIGGYDYSKKEVSRSVKIYTPSTKKWKDGPALPEGRMGGKAVQNGGKLIYTLGAGAAQQGKDLEEQSCPKTLILQGSKWSTSKQSINPYITGKPVTYNEDAFKVYSASVGLCAEGVLYAGTPTEGLGDTFIYNVGKDAYQAMKYSQIQDLSGDKTFAGVTCAGMLYGYDEEGNTYGVRINSGLLKVSAGKLSHGKIVNANKAFVPGTVVKLTASPSKGYVVKTFTVNGKKVKGKSTTIRLTSNMKASASFGKAVSKITLNKKKVTLKAGKTFKLKVKIAPKNAYSKKVTYKSSNTKYATVSKKGVIKAKKAGRGKKVTITVTAADGSGKKAKCTVKIRK